MRKGLKIRYITGRVGDALGGLSAYLATLAENFDRSGFGFAARARVGAGAQRLRCGARRRRGAALRVRGVAGAGHMAGRAERLRTRAPRAQPRASGRAEPSRGSGFYVFHFHGSATHSHAHSRPPAASEKGAQINGPSQRVVVVAAG